MRERRFESAVLGGARSSTLPSAGPPAPRRPLVLSVPPLSCTTGVRLSMRLSCCSIATGLCSLSRGSSGPTIAPSTWRSGWERRCRSRGSGRSFARSGATLSIPAGICRRNCATSLPYPVPTRHARRRARTDARRDARAARACRRGRMRIVCPAAARVAQHGRRSRGSGRARVARSASVLDHGFGATHHAPDTRPPRIGVRAALRCVASGTSPHRETLSRPIR